MENSMTKEIYERTLNQYQDVFLGQDTFFEWLVENACFIDRHPLEIEVNYMMYSIAKLSYAKGFISAYN